MKISKSWIGKDGYRKLRIEGITTKYSHYVWWQNTGYWVDWNKKEIIHHINNDSTDDRIENLQLMGMSEHVKLHLTGKKLSQEHKQKMVVSHKGMTGRKHTEETKLKLSEFLIGNTRCLGRKCSEETRQRMSVAQTKRWREI
jgi:hypothetical protein